MVLAAHGDPNLFAIRREEGLVRRPPDIRDVLHRVGRGVDERDRVRADRDDGEGATIGRETHAVHQQLPPIERTQVRRRRVAQPDDTEEDIEREIRHRLRGIQKSCVA